MKRLAVLVLALLLVPTPGLAQSDDPGSSAPSDWEPWFNETLNVRIPIDIRPGSNYPDEWDGPRPVTYELDLTQALIDAGWPTDATTGEPQRFTLDPDSIRVVPRGTGEEDPQPLPTIAWQGALVSEAGTHPPGHQIVTVAFLADEDVDRYHLYLDRTQDTDEHDPLDRDPLAEQRILQLLSGPGAGHDLVGAFGHGPNELLIAATSNAKVETEVAGPQGWTPASGCTGRVSSSPGSWLTCTISVGGNGITGVRVSATRPVAAFAWSGEDTNPSDEDHALQYIPLASPHGTQAGTTLMAPQPIDRTPVDLMGLNRSCVATYGAGQSSVTRVGTTPTRVTITDATRIEADCPIVGWIPGRGPAPMAIGFSEGITKTGLSLSEEAADPNNGISNNIVAIGDKGATALRFNTQSQETVEKRISRGSTLFPGHDGLRGTVWSNIEGSAGTGHVVNVEDALFWPYVWDGFHGSVPLAPTPEGSIGYLGPGASGLKVRLSAVPFSGTPPVSFGAVGVPLDTGDSNCHVTCSSTLRYGDDGLKNSGHEGSFGGIVETGLKGELRLVGGFAHIGDNGPSQAPSTLAGHMRSFAVDRGDPQVIGPLFDLRLDPESRIAAPGEVMTFELVGRGQIREATGETRPLTVALNVNSSQPDETVPPLEIDLGSAEATLPSGEAEKITTVTVSVPSAIPAGATPSFQLTVTGRPVSGGDEIETQATIQVVPSREISLTFEDGSKIEDLSTEDGHAQATMVLRNEGTANEDVTLSTTVPEQVGWNVRVLDAATGEEVSLVEDLSASGGERRLLLDVEAPGDTARVVTIHVGAQSTADASVSSEVTARVAHGVTVSVDSRVRPDLVTLTPGSQTTVNLTLSNQGSPVNVQIDPSSAEGMVLEPQRTSVNLGENGSDADNAVIPLNLTVRPDAPIGGVLVSTLDLQIRVSDLEPVQSLMSVRARVVPNHALEPVGALELLPGLEQSTTLTVRATGDADEHGDLSLLEVPQGWTVDAPDRLEVPRNTTGPIELTVTTPSQIAPGSYQITLLATPDDGTEPIPIIAPVAIDETPAFDLAGPPAIEMGLGANRTIQLSIENRGNAAGNTTIEAAGGPTEARLRPATLTLAPGEQRNVTTQLTAVQTGRGNVSFTANPGGSFELPVDVGRVELAIELVSTSPSTARSDEPYRSVVRVTNSGTTTARNVDVALFSGTERLKTERIGRLAPGEAATLSVGVTELPMTQDLSVQVDPDGRYTQENVADDTVSLSSQDVPMPPFTLVIVLIALASVALRRT